MAIAEMNINEIKENIDDISKKEAYLLYEDISYIKRTLTKKYPNISSSIYKKHKLKEKIHCSTCNKSVTGGAWFRHIKSEKHKEKLDVISEGKKN